MTNAVPSWRKRVLTSVPVAAFLLSAFAGSPAPARADDPLQPAVCFAPGTSEDVVAKRLRDAAAVAGKLRPSDRKSVV
jgi:hypothetical protein